MAIYVAVVIVFVRFALFIGFCWQLNLVYRQSAYVVRCMQYVKNLRWQFSQQFYHFIIISTTMRLNGGNAECFSQNPRFSHLLNFLVLPALPLSSSLWMCGCVPFSILHYFFFFGKLESKQQTPRHLDVFKTNNTIAKWRRTWWKRKTFIVFNLIKMSPKSTTYHAMRTTLQWNERWNFAM